jgi:hypothetical protein
VFDAFVSLALVAPAALFGRRKGGDRHGEINGSTTGGDEGHDAFSAFEGLLGDALATSVGAVDGSLALAADPADLDAPVDGTGDGTGDGTDDAPGWVVGDTSLDSAVGPEPSIDHGSVVPDEELWHPAPGEVSRLQPLVPFEEQFAAVGPTSDVWGPIAMEPIGFTDGVDQAAPFRLNRLRKVAGPEGEDLSRPVAAGGPGHGASDGRPAAAGANGHLIRGPVGRSRGRTSGRPIRRPAPNGAPVGTEAEHDRDDVAPVQEHAPAAPVAEIVDAPSAPVPVFVSADGMVSTGSGSVRVARPEDASASAGAGGLVVQLVDHWCWAALDEFGPDLTVRAGSTVLQVPAGTTALLSIDDDGAQLVVVLDGEGVVEHDGGRIRLRSGAMAYLPVDGDPQVDVAADEEIRSDPLVARNLALDKA